LYRQLVLFLGEGDPQSMGQLLWHGLGGYIGQQQSNLFRVSQQAHTFGAVHHMPLDRSGLIAGQYVCYQVS
jgi:hypothetical protein